MTTLSRINGNELSDIEEFYDESKRSPSNVHYIRLRRPYAESLKKIPGFNRGRAGDLSFTELHYFFNGGVPIMAQIDITEDHRALHKYFGEFTNISGIFMYKNMLVTRGQISFRNKKYAGLEFLADQNVDVKSEAENFIKDIYAAVKYKGNSLYKISNVFKVLDK